MTRVDEVMELMSARGADEYFGEPVSQLEHALQSAHYAAQAGSARHLVAAALLHDIGHLLHERGEDATDRGIDTVHEEDGYRWLLDRFGASVAEPVRQHVAAKRYLCAVEREYFARLSPASVQSLRLQGGPFSPEEVRAFEALPCFWDATALRRWDDQAKIPGLVVAPLQGYRPLLEAL
jgi:[1-hydroxy-2-(trimethylamino)ethyl]phosphonate dioxygenase